MKRTILATFLILFWAKSMAQSALNIKAFNDKFETVQWLCKYDNIAWHTSDSVSASPAGESSKLGREWFCFEEKDIWHAVYGSFKAGNYDVVFHYLADTAGGIKRVYSPIDSALTNSYARALVRANAGLKSLLDSTGVSLNQYIRKNTDSSLSVWLLPAFTQESVAVYGGEFYYQFDPTGNKLIDSVAYFQGHFKGFKANNPREIWLNYRDVEQPTLGAIFFVWYYKQYFTQIFIDTKILSSTVRYEPDKGYYWFHIVKD